MSGSRSCRLEIDDCVDVVDFIFPGFQWYVVRMDNSSCCVSGIGAVQRKVGLGESVDSLVEERACAGSFVEEAER